MRTVTGKLEQTASKGESGFSLIECLFGLIITMVGVLAVVALMAVGVRLQVEARDASEASGSARAKLEQLYNYATTASQRTPGGSLTTDTTNYFDNVDTRFRRRWMIEGPGGTVPANTQRITVVVVSNRGDVRLPAVSLVTLVPAS